MFLYARNPDNPIALYASLIFILFVHSLFLKKIVRMDKEASKLNETLEYVASKHAEMIECDVTNTASVDSSVEQALKFFQRKAQRPVIDFLWNNAGYQGQIAPTLDYDPKDFANVMNINVTGMFIMLQAVAKKMSADGGNNRSFSIVNTASVAGLRGTPAMVAYSSSKAAVLALTVCCAKVSHVCTCN